MNVTSVLLARAIRLAETRSSPMYLPDILRAIQQRYAFVRAPRSPDEILALQHQFEHGKLVHDERTILISLFQSFPRGFTAETPLSTDDGDLVVDDMMDVATRELKIEFTEVPPGRAYVSHLEVTGEFRLERFEPMIGTAGTALQAAFASYGQSLPAFRVSGISMAVAPNHFPLACDFRIERRANLPYETNTYFSQAPLRTSDHIALLEQCERESQS